MLSESEVQKFRADGFLGGGQVLSDDEVEVLRAELERVIRDQGRADVPQPVSIVNLFGNPESPIWQVVNIFHASEPYRRLMFNPKVIEEVAQLTGARELRI